MQNRTYTFVTKDVQPFSPIILCLIVTSPHYHASRAQHVLGTWAKHCSNTFFLTSEDDSIFPETIVNPKAASYDDLWEKVSYGKVTTNLCFISCIVFHVK